jgi:hypothetical protein
MDLKSKKWLIFIFFLTLTLRLILAFSNPGFTYDSYFHLRQVEHISQTGLPLYDDNLSYGGRVNLFLPFFHYFIGFFTLFLPLEFVGKLIPNLLMSLLPIIVYFISKKISKDTNAPFFSALITGFLPILYFTNSFSPDSLFLPLLFLTIFSFLNLESKKFQYLYVISFLLLSLTSSVTILLIIGFMIYILLSFLEGKKPPRAEFELMLFSVIFFIWTQFLFFKNTLLKEGLNFIWQNIPLQIIQEYFPKFSILEAIVLVSIIPFLAGIFVVYQSLFKSKNEDAFLLISFVISTTLLAWFRLIKFRLSLAFFGIVLAILFAIFYDEMLKFISRTKFSHLKNRLSIILALIIFLTMIFPAILESSQQNIPNQDDINAFRWLQENSQPGEKIVALLEEGHLITYYSKRKNLMDDHFSLITDIEERFVELGDIFITPFQTLAVGLFDKYDVDYIIFSSRAKEKYSKDNFQYITANCYERIYKSDIKIYRVKCELNQENVQ